MFRRLTAVVFCSVLMAHMPGAQAATSTLVSIKTPRGAAQQFILIKPEAPVASVILFAGGHGALGLKSASSMSWRTLGQHAAARSRSCASRRPMCRPITGSTGGFVFASSAQAPSAGSEASGCCRLFARS